MEKTAGAAALSVQAEASAITRAQAAEEAVAASADRLVRIEGECQRFKHIARELKKQRDVLMHKQQFGVRAPGSDPSSPETVPEVPLEIPLEMVGLEDGTATKTALGSRRRVQGSPPLIDESVGAPGDGHGEEGLGEVGIHSLIASLRAELQLERNRAVKAEERVAMADQREAQTSAEAVLLEAASAEAAELRASLAMVEAERDRC